MLCQRYSDWKTRFHETFSRFQRLDVQNLDLNMYRDVPGLIVELGADYSLICCSITHDLSSVIPNMLEKVRSPESIVDVHTYMYYESTKSKWHYWLGRAKQDLKTNMKT